MIEIIKTHPLAIFNKDTESSIGYDLCTIEDIFIFYCDEYCLAPTGIYVNMMEDSYVTHALLYAAPNLFNTTGLILTSGVGIIEKDYRDEILVPLYRVKKHGINIPAGTRIAQLVFNYTSIHVNAIKIGGLLK